MANSRCSEPHKAVARRPTGKDWPALGRARISPMASRVTWRHSKEPEWPLVRLRPPALPQVFRRQRAIVILADFCLAGTATVRPPLPARLLKAAWLPGLCQGKYLRGRLGRVSQLDMQDLTVRCVSSSLQHCP